MSQAGSESPEVVLAVLERLPVGALMVAADGTIVLLNGEIERTFGYQRSELIGRSVDRLVGAGWWARQGRPRVEGGADAGRGTTPARSRLVAERRDGSEFPIEITLSAVAVAGESFLIASVIDLADRGRGGSEPVPPPGGPLGGKRLQDENAYLRNELRALSGAPPLVGHSQAFRRVVDQVRHAAGSDAPALLVGEMGTGKSLLAARIHELSARGARVMVRVNCARAGAGFDAGRLAVADGSTVLFDEIGSLPLEAQDALIQLLDNPLIHPAGREAPVKLDLRVIATTRTDLTQRVAQGAFRGDLYERLNVLNVRVSPLRERPEDIPPLVWRFVDEFSEAFGQPIDAIDKQTMAAMQRYAWPGNARELQNVVERGMMAATTRRLRLALPSADATAIGQQTLAALEREHIRATIAACGGELRGEQGAAARLGLTFRELTARMQRLGLRPRRSRSAIRSGEGA